MSKNFILSAGLFTLTTVMATSSIAAITGQVEVKLDVSSGCTVNNAKVDGNFNKFGVLDFGKTSSTWSNVLTAELTSAQGGGDLTVTCDADVKKFNVSVNGGERGDRTLQFDTDTIQYDVYQDVARTQSYTKDSNISFDVNGETKVPMFGAVPVTTEAKTAGIYTDTLLVTVSF